jgi:predicted anti-sigma-YlaC factor YlaD
MFCDEALESVEAIAAGELTPEGRIGAHLASCPNCASALETARTLERLLRERPVPAPSPQFTARTLARVRRARWRSEQFLDAGFNLVIVIVVAAVVTGVWLLLHRSGLSVVGNDAVDVFSSGLVAVARRVAPSLPLYAGATALLATALAIWWWAERDLRL